MRKWMSCLAILCVLPVSGCGVRGTEPAAEPAPDHVLARLDLSASEEVAKAMPAHLVGLRRESRTIEDDPDADGIPDYRVIITDTFDAEGNLLLTSRDEDFEADGIIDARSVTKYDE